MCQIMLFNDKYTCKNNDIDETMKANKAKCKWKIYWKNNSKK